MKNKIIYFIAFMMSGCVSQNSAPIEYNRGKDFSNKLVTTDSHSAQHSDQYSNDDESEIITREINNKEKDFDYPTGSLREPIKDNKKQDDIIIVPEIRKDNKIIYHEVQQGETLTSIANDYGQKVEELAQFNRLTSNNLAESQIIKIRISNEILNKKNKELTLRKVENVKQPNIVKFIKPISGNISGNVITKFGEQTANGKSKGINIIANEGSAVESIASGKVVFAGKDVRFGNLLIVELADSNLFVAYAHLQDLIIQKGANIVQGQVIGHVGHTGDAQQSMLHFAIREGKLAVDPLKYVDINN
jgi:murein DD-endopeptidase MepM/ murein hydrolase activator NlpD